eukprot:275687-Pelagomonas_calceolata.AAC.3
MTALGIPISKIDTRSVLLALVNVLSSSTFLDGISMKLQSELAKLFPGALLSVRRVKARQENIGLHAGQNSVLTSHTNHICSNRVARTNSCFPLGSRKGHGGDREHSAPAAATPSASKV